MQVDLDHDRVVSMDEFLRSTEKKEFNNAKEWQVRKRFRIASAMVAGVAVEILFFCFKSPLFSPSFMPPSCIYANQTLDDTRPVYSEEELQRFEVELRDKEAELGRKAESLRQEQDLLQERGKALEAQKREYQQVVMELRHSISLTSAYSAMSNSQINMISPDDCGQSPLIEALLRMRLNRLLSTT